MKNIYLDTNSIAANKKIGLSSTHRTKTAIALVATLAVSFLSKSFLSINTNAVECTTSPCNTTFQVNVKESLSVSITTPEDWASGNANVFLRNKINLDVSTNSSGGFTAYMHSKDTTNLTNAIDGSTTIATLASSTTKNNFTANRWGYSLDASSYNGNTYGEADDITTNSTYHPMSTSDITILDGTTYGSRDIYFGTKTNISQASGTYLGTVVFTVVTDNTPSQTPATPTDDAPDDGLATYDNTNDRTVYTTISSSGSGTTTTTEVSAGDVTDLYVPAQGEIRRTESSISDGSQVATDLAIAASTVAASGMIFFILAKRREDDEEEEDEFQQF